MAVPNPPYPFEVAAAEIFNSLRLELLPRQRKTIPPVLFLHRREPASNRVEVTSVQLTPFAREIWPRTIALQVLESAAEWWAISVELRLRTREEDRPTADDEDDVPDVSHWLVVTVCSPSRQDVWCGALTRDPQGRLLEIASEQQMPSGTIRDQILQMLGNRCLPLDD